MAGLLPALCHQVLHHLQAVIGDGGKLVAAIGDVELATALGQQANQAVHTCQPFILEVNACAVEGIAAQFEVNVAVLRGAEVQPLPDQPPPAPTRSRGEHDSLRKTGR